ncbi:HRDC domain-containing protein [Rothia aerolata]|uniref:3'-5' exonuclease n=1 Tax=Rothia aerolata TaxID=1812262 RepID=A0A917IL17_9MICC|nr:HRDC domain-containing protein [Rothia aerolata]GGH56836.1 3'-5' exonuclease [Rothia aerolata]
MAQAEETELTCEQLGLSGLTIPRVVELNEPSGGVPSVISTQRGLDHALEALRSAEGPVAVDTERASGIRYGQRAFLVQLKRGDSGIILIDPEAFENLSAVNDALRGVEWVVHASTQDLPCLRDLGMHPDFLFDTELAARLAGFEKVGLGAVVERMLGFKLAKEHSASDWSKRPLPPEWLIYAALDVDILLDLRDAMEEVLEETGKLEFARQEFAYIAASPGKEAAKDPWRKTKGIHALRNRRQLTALRNIWFERDKLARKKDVASKRLLPDSSLIEAARTMPRSVPAVLSIPGFQTRALRREGPRWVRAINAALHEKNPVPYTTPADGPPPLKAWENKRPESYALIQASKEAIYALAEELQMPHDNVLTPDTLRRLCWDPPREVSEQALARELAAMDARPWQIEQVLPVLLPIFDSVLGHNR